MRTKLKLLRVERNWTQKDVAEKIGIAVPSYALIERGNRFGSHKTWEKIKALYNLKDKDMYEIQTQND